MQGKKLKRVLQNISDESKYIWSKKNRKSVFSES